MRRTLPVQVYRERDARERVLLMRQALLEDREPDPDIRRSTPPQQYGEANHFIRLANGMLGILTPWALSLCQEAEQTRTIAVLHLMARLARAHGAPSPESLDDATIARLQRDLDRLGPRLTCVELVVGEVESEFGSETVTPIEVRDFLIAAAAHIHEVLEMVPGLHEPASEPDQEILEMLRRGLRES